MEKIEILLATYNGEKYIREQIDSILNQTYTNWIIRAADDNSKDNTYSILREYQELYPDKFIIEKNEPGTGCAKNNFLGLLKKSSCDYIMCCDQDDVWLPNKVELTYNAMKKSEKNQIPVLVHTDLKVVDGDLNIIDESFFEYSKLKKEFTYKDLLIQNYVTGCTMMLNRSLVELVNEESEYTKILMHDWLVALVAATCGKVVFVNQSTMLYRQHGINSVGAKRYGIALFMEKFIKGHIKESFEASLNQAGQFALTYKKNLDEDKLKIVEAYSKLIQLNKLQRIHFCLKNRILKNGKVKAICQLIFC